MFDLLIGMDTDDWIGMLWLHFQLLISFLIITQISACLLWASIIFPFLGNLYIASLSLVYQVSFPFLPFFMFQFFFALCLIWPWPHKRRSIYSPMFSVLIWISFFKGCTKYVVFSPLPCIWTKTSKQIMIPSFESLKTDVLRKPFHFRRRAYRSCVSFIMDNVE